MCMSPKAPSTYRVPRKKKAEDIIGEMSLDYANEKLKGQNIGVLILEEMEKHYKYDTWGEFLTHLYYERTCLGRIICANESQYKKLYNDRRKEYNKKPETH